MEARQERGLQIAEHSKIVKTPVGWKVPSQSGNGTYIVNLDHGHPFCTCPDFEARNQPCKHIHAVEFTIQRETKPDGQGWYHWFSNIHLYVEVLAWDKVLRDAELRNRMFFKKLGLIQ